LCRGVQQQRGKAEITHEICSTINERIKGRFPIVLSFLFSPTKERKEEKEFSHLLSILFSLLKKGKLKEMEEKENIQIFLFIPFSLFFRERNIEGK
jgi:hypothetical protein